MEITKEQVLDIYGTTGNLYLHSKLEKWFPEAFIVKLEVGKVYKYKDTNKLIKITELKNDDFDGYGFNLESEYGENITGYGISSGVWSEATTEEWESALIAEAKKRGYKKGLLIQDIYNGNSVEDLVNVSSDLFDYESIKAGVNQGKMALRDSDGSIIFYEGIWAEIIKTFSKEEAEKLLGGRII